MNDGECRSSHPKAQSDGSSPVLFDDSPESLRRSNAFLQYIFEDSPSAIWISDHAGTLLRMNQACRDLFRVTDTEVVGRYNIFADDVVRERGVLPLVKRVFEDGEVVKFELDYASWGPADASTARVPRVYVETTIYPVKGESGNVINAVIQLVDVTGLKQIEDALRRSEARLLQAQAIAHLGNWEIDLQAGTMWGSEEAFRIYGVERSSPYVTLERAQSYVVADDRPRMDAALEDLLRGRSPYDLEFRVRRPNDGALRVIHSIADVVRDETGKPLKVIGVIQDVTERKRSEDSMTWLSRILDQSLNEVYVFDAESLRFVQVNHGAQRNLGYTIEELTRLTPLDLKPAFTRPTFEELIAPLRAGREQQLVFETDHRRKDGSLYPVEVHLQLTERDTRPMFLAIILDVTERRAAEEALTASEEQLRQSQKMEAVGRLAGGIAHDFNNLLTAMVGYSDLLLARIDDDPDALRPDIEEIKRAAERASSLTAQILAFSRRQTLHPRVVSLNDVLTGLEPLLRRTLGEDIELVTLQHADLGLVELDTHQFEQVVMNLAVNARDAMPVGGRLTIETSNVELDAEFALAHPEVTPGSYVMIAVTDTGEGVGEEIMASIFEPFFTTKAMGKGTGLGLSTVYGIVRQSGGLITVESREGEGACFKVYLPWASAAAKAPEMPVPSAPSLTRGGETILLVEDEAALRRLTARVLEGLGYRVFVAESGVEAVEVLRLTEHVPDLLLTDMVLPGGIPGHQLAEKLWPSSAGVPVLYMSGYAPDVIVPTGRPGEEVHFLQKPFSPDQLEAAVRKALDSRPRRV